MSRPAPAFSLRALALLLALTFQAFAIGSHVHLQTPLSQQHHQDDSGNCPLCQSLQTAGQFILPAAIEIVVPRVVGFAEFQVLMAQGSFAAPAHDWLSRAPPRT